MAISDESVMPEIAVHSRPMWSEECEEIICPVYFTFAEIHWQSSNGSGGKECFREREGAREGSPPYTETEGHVSLGSEDRKDTGGADVTACLLHAAGRKRRCLAASGRRFRQLGAERAVDVNKVRGCEWREVLLSVPHGSSCSVSLWESGLN